jgi:hypothetical protein
VLQVRRLLAAAIVLIVAATAFPAAAQAIGLAETESIFADLTRMSYGRSHGTQVEYNAPNGSTYLLYPGNTVVVKGSWKVTRTDKPNVFNICFKYPTNSYNPATGQTGGEWECQIAGFYLAASAEIMDGDVLGLADSTEVPFVLARRKTTLAALIRKAR